MVLRYTDNVWAGRSSARVTLVVPTNLRRRRSRPRRAPGASGTAWCGGAGGLGGLIGCRCGDGALLVERPLHLRDATQEQLALGAQLVGTEQAWAAGSHGRRVACQHDVQLWLELTKDAVQDREI